MDDGDVPPRPLGLRGLPRKVLKLLKDRHRCKITRGHLKTVLGSDEGDVDRLVHDTNPRGKLRLNDDGKTLSCCWSTKDPLFTDLLRGTSWIKAGGRVRNQLYHIICWAYAASDLVSAVRVIHKLEGAYVALCTWYLCSTVDPDMLGKDEDAPKGHACYGSSIKTALQHIAENGIPREIEKNREFDCTRDSPSAATAVFRIDSHLSFDTLGEALDHFHNQPIGASLVIFPEMWYRSMETEIYRGPLGKTSTIEGYHGVMIVAVELYQGELVAVCKLSNGRHVGKGGYIRVSLRVMYMVLGSEGQDCVRPTPTPQHLLSCFVCPVINGVSIQTEKASQTERAAKRRRLA